MHATGRSAAFWLESYGGPTVALLSAASRDFLANPPGDFSELGFLRDARRRPPVARRAIGPSCRDGVAAARRRARTSWSGWSRASGRSGAGRCSSRAAPTSTSPALHAAYLRRFRRRGGTVATDAGVTRARQFGGRLDRAARATASTRHRRRSSSMPPAPGPTRSREACGVRRSGIAPKRRTMVQLRVGRSGLRDLPLVDDAAGTFYFKGEGDRSVWLSPHDEIASDPCDAAPEEIDIATAIDRFEQVGRLAGRSGRAELGGPAELRARPHAGLRLRSATRRASSGASGRAASASRPRRRRPSWRRRCCSASRPTPMVRGHRPGRFSPPRFALEPVSAAACRPRRRRARRPGRSRGGRCGP